ncbi:MAG: DNA-deoxyinosine glycosylase, partial [Burkholderiales bacterium]
ADIEEGSIAVNDFAGFFDAHPRIGAVFFNGAKAESAYRRHVLKGLPAAAGALPALRLPSTSPAHAALSFDRKLSVWQVLRR